MFDSPASFPLASPSYHSSSGLSLGYAVHFHRSFSLAVCLDASALLSTMACPLTVSKFVGTVSLGLLTGMSYSAATVTLPSLKLLPTSSNAARSFNEVKRLNRKHGLRFTSIANACLLFAYRFSPAHRKHPYLIWMGVTSTLATCGLDYWFHRQNGLKAWFQSWSQDVGCSFSGQKAAGKKESRKEDDLVVVEAEENVNGESIEQEMETERRFQLTRAVLSGLALTMGIVGLWGDRK